MCPETGFGPNQTYSGDGIGTIKPTIFREGSGFLGIVFRNTYEPKLNAASPTDSCICFYESNIVSAGKFDGSRYPNVHKQYMF